MPAATTSKEKVCLKIGSVPLAPYVYRKLLPGDPFIPGALHSSEIAASTKNGLHHGPLEGMIGVGN